MKALIILLLSVALLRAGTEEDTSAISGEAGVTVTNAFIFNGLVQEKGEVITQPYVTLNLELIKRKDWDLGFTLPLWASIHRSRWYEFDISPGFYLTLTKNWSLTVSDYIYTSPGRYFSTSHNLSVALEYEDLIGLRPYFNFQQELSGHAGLALEGESKGQYYEVGVRPSRSLGSVTVLVPVAVGMGTNGFYGRGFGYMSAGAEAEVPIAFIPTSYGSWKATASVRYYHLGPNSSSYTNDGKSNQWVGALTVGTEF